MPNFVIRRFVCDFPGCYNIGDTIVERNPQETPCHYFPLPEGWKDGYSWKYKNVRLCANHADLAVKHREIYALWRKERDAIAGPAHEAARKAYDAQLAFLKKWEEENPEPKPPWVSNHV